MWRTQFIGRRVWLWSVYVVVVIVVVLIHYRGEVFETGCGSLTWTAKLWHQRLCTAGHRKPRTHYVRVITLAAASEPIGDKCEGRKFLASLLPRLRDLGASVIVIDKWYLPTACANPAATAALQDKVNLVSQTVPIVLAQDSDTYDELQANNDPAVTSWKKLNLAKDDQVLADSAIAVDGKDSHFGLARLACNNWQIPLTWTVHPPLYDLDAMNKKGARMDALGFAAAKMFDGNLAEVMHRHVDNHDDLVGAFLPLAAFRPLRATQILCGLQTIKYDPSSCTPGDPREVSLKGNLVLIGEYSEADTHESVIGNVPGFLLQANYIESLLDDRYYQLIPRWLEIILAILCFVAIDITIEKARSPHLGALLAVAGVAGLWAIAHFFIMQWGYYFTFWFPAILVVVPKWLEALKKIPSKVVLTPVGQVP
jgi:hypothetical protein